MADRQTGTTDAPIADDDISAWKKEDGSLRSGRVIDWQTGRLCVRLDGLFYASRLRAIADHMDACRKEKER